MAKKIIKDKRLEAIVNRKEFDLFEIIRDSFESINVLNIKNCIEHSYMNLRDAWSVVVLFILFGINSWKEWCIEVFLSIFVSWCLSGWNLFFCFLGNGSCFTGLLSFEEIINFICFSWLLFDSNFALCFEKSNHSSFFLKTKVRIKN